MGRHLNYEHFGTPLYCKKEPACRRIVNPRHCILGDYFRLIPIGQGIAGKAMSIEKSA
jgi:hypothetical protein